MDIDTLLQLLTLVAMIAGGLGAFFKLQGSHKGLVSKQEGDNRAVWHEVNNQRKMLIGDDGNGGLRSLISQIEAKANMNNDLKDRMDRLETEWKEAIKLLNKIAIKLEIDT